VLDIKPKKRKVHSLTGRITPTLMLSAWKAVKRNKGAAGVDHVTIQIYEKNLHNNLRYLMTRMKNRGSYRSPPLKRVYIPKGKTGKMRPLGIPTVDARIAQEVVRQLLEPIFEPQFHDHSFGFRPGRGCHQAVTRVLQYTRDGYEWTVDVDIKGFFDNIDHTLIMSFLRAEIADGNILDIIETFLASGVKEDDVIKPTTMGTPQGGVISPLLANIVLNFLDWQLQEAGFIHVRYADDFVIVCKTKKDAERALAFTLKVLDDLKLECAEEKTKIANLGKGFAFLGFDINKRRVKIREKSREKFEDALKDATKRSHNFDAEVILRVNRIIRGTINYFCTGFSHVMRYFHTIGEWLRRRLRCMKYKTISRKHNLRLKNKILSRLGVDNIRELCLKAKERWKCSPHRGKQIGAAR
jgi:group II intron reverse transcriptase/maturase